VTEPPARVDGESMRAVVGMRHAGAACVAALVLAGCPAPRQAFRPPPVPLDTATHHEELALAGVVHVVRRGETIWRIARAYGIDPGDLMETNGIADPRTVEVGAELFVPGATQVVEVPAAGGESSATPTPAETNGSTAVHPEPFDRLRAGSAPSAEAEARSRRAPTSTSTATPTPTRAPVSSAQPAPATARGAPPLAWPLRGVLYGRYGVRAGKRHDGIDIAAPEGTPVVAAAAGIVIFAGEQPGYGAILIVKHEGGLVTLYAHNSRLLVDEGARVKRGDAIARVGQTGRTTGPHLHFEVRDGTRPRNPLLFLP
jgi:lipoprotein NlpD